METNDNIWYKDPSILINKDRVFEIGMKINTSREVNATVRLIIIITIILLLVTNYVKYVLIFSLIAVILVTIYYENNVVKIAKFAEPIAVAPQELQSRAQQVAPVNSFSGLQNADTSKSLLYEMLGIQTAWQNPYHDHQVPFNDGPLRDNSMLRAKDNYKYGLDNYTRGANIADLYEKTKIGGQYMMAPNYTNSFDKFKYSYNDRRPMVRSY